MSKNSENFFSSVIDGIAEQRTTHAEIEEVLDLYGSVFQSLSQTYLSFKPDMSGLTKKHCRGRNTKGLPMLTVEDIKIDKKLYKKNLIVLTQAIRTKSKGGLPKSFSIDPLLERQQRSLRGLIEDGELIEKMAGQLEMEHPVLNLYIHFAFLPFIRKYAELLQSHLDSKNWLRGYCPICGREPLIAGLEGDLGQKWLLCSLCHTMWLYKRLTCPFCANEDQSSLKYFTVDDEGTHRVDVCDKCKRYIKTVDSRKLHTPRNLFVEALSTLALDLVAEKEGYSGGDSSVLH